MGHYGVANLQKRFWTKVDQRGETDCWVWLGSTNQDGYGRFNVYCLVKHNKLVQAHRFAYETRHGEIPTGLAVLHTCDHPACCNPAHLFLGTQSDNMRDMHKKRRHTITGGWKWARNVQRSQMA